MCRCHLPILAIILVLPATAMAHFPWVTIDGKDGKHGAVNFYFEHSAKPGDGAYLDPFVERGTMWLQTPSAEKAVKLKAEDTKEGKLRWWKAELEAPAPRSVDVYTKWGVYRYGKNDTLLHYYARNIEAQTAEQLNALAASNNLGIQLQPRWEGSELQVRAVRDGKPMPKQQIKFRGPTVSKNYTTNEDGVATIPIEKPGRYLLRTEVKLPDEAGNFNGKDYVQVHHHSTLILRLPPMD